MPSISDNQPGQKLNNQPENKDAATNTQKNSQVEVNIKILTVNVFFDGTNNNMFNTQIRLDNADIISKGGQPTQEDKDRETKAGDTSKGNDFSNVALLYMASTKKDGKVEIIYIQGAGTTKYKADSLLWGAGMAKDGLVTGDGPADTYWSTSGVESRVQEAITKLKNFTSKSDKIQRVIINVFGFSRGSFYARYFCAQLTKVKKEDADLKNKKVQINFVGIYDTVSSAGTNHYDDVKEFELNTGSKHVAGRIVHLTAQNDYRYHFPLTHINTAIGDGIGFECSFPGAHSDIGGGYTVKTEEKKYLSKLDKGSVPYYGGEIRWEWFKEKGYFRGDPRASDMAGRGEFKIGYKAPIGGNSVTTVVYGNRTVWCKDYQFILAKGMQEITKKAAAMEYNGLKKKYLNQGITSMQSHSLLNKLDGQVTQYLLANYKNNECSTFSLVQAGLSAQEQQQLYHDYLHISLEADAIIPANVGLDAQTDPPHRAEIKDNV
ncbi:T6SS phospholipase effector Tle1-like catalytic domain-containing protein [Commensalibacter nepenthis]|uniref:DUF2235 domain-containing protein n=1 Tax=Commensalibacter nepenthis TaxID=3043872 RepID=A0ABT6Q4C7_9PROT|nr:DUF2235 domain-containing protein [Commensalibacter sp. TBRC 10068]MDI2111755.1 DUF2235 domain-containing protein [Commensalibacter sp. TBRC 10068]